MSVRQANLGWFLPFMQAFGGATVDTRAELYAETLQYEAKALPAAEYVADVADALDLPVPS